MRSIRKAAPVAPRPDLPAATPQPREFVVLPGEDAAIEREPGQPVRIVIRTENALKLICGSERHQFNSVILDEVVSTMAGKGTVDDDGVVRRIAAATAALAAFKPVDELEGMLAAQAVALHFGAMECFRRAMVLSQPAEYATKLRKDGTNMARAMTDMIDALDRKRGKGPQVVRVERVVVQEGGQAVVGNVQTGGGG